jgi:hypothetical protein
VLHLSHSLAPSSLYRTQGDDNDDDDDDDDDSGAKKGPKSGKGAARGKGAGVKGVKLGGSVFASAEEFSHLLEEDTDAADTQSKWEGSRSHQNSAQDSGHSRGAKGSGKGGKQSYREPRSVRPGESRRRPSKRARMTGKARK